MPGHTKFPGFKRKDSLTAQRVGQLRDNIALQQQAFRKEHIERTSLGFIANGEHNSPLIARGAGTLAWSGSAYSLVGFPGTVALASGHNPQIGAVIFTVELGVFESAFPVMVQNASNTGATSPCLSWGDWMDTSRFRTFSTYWTGTLGVSGSGFWTSAGDDANLHVAIHSSAQSVGQAAGLGGSITRQNGLRSGSTSTYFNAMIQTAADLQYLLDREHRNGVHNIRQIPKASCHVIWTGSAHAIVAQDVCATFDGAYFSGISSGGTGIIDITFAAPLATTNYQVFVDVDYARSTGAPSDYRIICAPRSSIGLSGFRLYVYKRLLNAGVEYFDRASDVDFYVWVHDDH